MKIENINFIIALDFEPDFGTDLLLELAEKYHCGIKIGWPYLLKEGKKRVKELLHNFNVYSIADLKLADIGFVMSLLAEEAFNLGFNGIIGHAFVGIKGAIDTLLSKTSELNLDLFLVTAMSHPGAEEVLNKNFETLLKIANEANVKGVIAPATMSHYIAKAREKLLPTKKILSPGVGAQGAAIGSAKKAGADYEIIGRFITKSSDPEKRIKDVLKIYEGLL